MVGINSVRKVSPNNADLHDMGANRCRRIATNSAEMPGKASASCKESQAACGGPKKRRLYALNGSGRIGALTDPDRHPGLDFPRSKDAKIPAEPTIRDGQGGHGRQPAAPRQCPTRLPGLRHLQQDLADTIAITDGDNVLINPGQSEVFAKSAVGKVGTPEFSLPTRIMVTAVRKNRFLGATMHGAVGLPIPDDVLLFHGDRSGHRYFDESRELRFRGFVLILNHGRHAD